MAEGEGEAAGSRAGRLIDVVDHPLLFMLATTLFVVAFINILYYLCIKAGWTGPASLFK